MDNETKQREIVSPEGIEERVVNELVGRITLTGGGKYRIYIGISEPEEMRSIAVADTEDEAKKKLGGALMMWGGLLVDPKRALAAILGPGE